MQAKGVVAPGAELYRPASHMFGAAIPVTLQYAPGLQLRHAEASDAPWSVLNLVAKVKQQNWGRTVVGCRKQVNELAGSRRTETPSTPRKMVKELLAADSPARRAGLLFPCGPARAVKPTGAWHSRADRAVRCYRTRRSAAGAGTFCSTHTALRGSRHSVVLSRRALLTVSTPRPREGPSRAWRREKVASRNPERNQVEQRADGTIGHIRTLGECTTHSAILKPDG